MSRLLAMIAGAFALAAFAPADPQATHAEAEALPCGVSGYGTRTSEAFGAAYNAARNLVAERRHTEALEASRRAYSFAQNQAEALAVVQLETAAYAGLGEQGWILWSLREQLRIEELCPGSLPEPTVNAHRRTILGLEDELSRKRD